MTESNWTPLPDGSHLMLPDDGGSGWHRGAEVVALRSAGHNEHGEVMTHGGDIVRLDRDRFNLVVGPMVIA